MDGLRQTRLEKRLGKRAKGKNDNLFNIMQKLKIDN
jgi:hypothetical protein